MRAVYPENENESNFIFTGFQSPTSRHLLRERKLFKIIWCTDLSQELIVDGGLVNLQRYQLLFCTPENIIEIPETSPELLGYLFPAEFYNLQNQKSDNGANGILFYGLDNAPVIQLEKRQQKIIEAIHILIQEEFRQKDDLQGEMLCLLLQRILFTATRVLQMNQGQHLWSNKQVDLVKRFNLLVELHFKEKHQVADYAELLSRSPKTLSNLFKKHDIPSPLKIINGRIMLEAKRLLHFSNLTAEEIGQKLGYSEPSHFSKFFKKQTGTSPLSFRK
ncbi:helix-turn-helix domain-containing protein [Nonlabens marinus]|uniref:Transcriptional regulator, AraC family n=1 Tax=Nonlabens marinus S1-08 TaxID=1454201 RepID=W8VVZ9_9FLAO|nr:helix-turn-helix domain-containing protein [Nonlabens marinus]BAO54312.1 transcriptional regulator, AraC family [Nonlabens marinus S1-08]